MQTKDSNLRPPGYEHTKRAQKMPWEPRKSGFSEQNTPTRCRQTASVFACADILGNTCQPVSTLFVLAVKDTTIGNIQAPDEANCNDAATVSAQVSGADSVTLEG